ncbi:MAG: ABC transporter substrate-binding protein [Betaproteobacteria bacterium]|nr:ABC transporter substrate-binding protein [Betaproteobacteria bacterium]
MIPIRQILFVPPAPIVWAQQLGLFAKHGLDLGTTQTLSSDQLGQGLADGTWDVGICVVDNVIAWNEERKAGLQIIAQLERATIMAFCGLAKYAALADAAAESIAVDSTTNGFVLVLYRALARAGIDWRGCRYEAVGGVRHRFEALDAGKAAATILVPPFIDMALSKGFRKLWAGEDIAPAYPGVVVAARAEWLRANEVAARAYLGALLEANAWGARTENADAAVAALVAARYAEPAAKRLVRDIVPGLAPSPAGWDEVVSLRRECGLLPSPAPTADDVINSALLARS